MNDVVSISAEAAAGLTRIGIGDFYEAETPERMAWISLILARLEDRPEWFPRGKWATIQNIDRQLAEVAKDCASKLNSLSGGRA
jgi:hypothetical protein